MLCRLLPPGATPAGLHTAVSALALAQHLQAPALQVNVVEAALNARCRRVFANAHTYHINSVSISSDGESFISSDDLRVNLWHMEHSNQSFNIVDMKPANMEDLTEVSGQPNTPLPDQDFDGTVTGTALQQDSRTKKQRPRSGHPASLPACMLCAGADLHRVSPPALLAICLQQQQGGDQAGRHAVSSVVRGWSKAV